MAMTPPRTETITTSTLGGSKRLARWPVGDAIIVDRGNATPVPVGRYVALGTLVLPAGGRFDVSAAIRLPAGCWARWRWVRVRWGSDPDGRDETGAQPLLPPPQDPTRPCSFTPRGHPLIGGGPLIAEIHVTGPGDTATLTVCKLIGVRIA